MSPLLSGAPWLIAHRSMLGINRPRQLTLNGNDYVMWQNAQGQVFALENVCPHMQAPLSQGWICPERDTIACPFHDLEFDGQGHLYQADVGKLSAQPLARSLDITVRGDFIWTYGNCSPQIPIPDLPERLTQGMTLVGVASDRRIQADLRRTLKVNYDFNHGHAVHRHPLKLQRGQVSDYERSSYTLRIKQHIVRDPNTWLEMLRRPALAFTPKQYVNNFEYSFPAVISFATALPIGQIASLFLVYPETEQQTRLFILVYAQVKFRGLIPLLRASTLASYDLINEQDATMLEQLYASEQPKIRLPDEEIMFDIEQLYDNWPPETDRRGDRRSSNLSEST